MASSMKQLDQFDVLPAATEGTDLEFKAAKGGLPGSFWESYSAMANTEGGLILLGVAERNGVLSWDGVADPAQLRTTLWNQINDRQKVSVNLLTADAIKIWAQEGRQFVAVTVPRATREQRPVYVGQNPITGTYRRAEDGDYHCSADEVRRLLADQSAAEPGDARILDHFGVADLDRDSVKQYRNRFSSRTPDHPWLSEDDTGLLLKLGGMRRERASGQVGVTVAGLLMFGSFEALRDGLPSYHVDYREKLSTDPAVRWTDRVTADGTWQPNLFQFYQRVRQRLGADIKLPFQLDADQVRRGESPAHEALREALVNAMVHADHQGPGGVIVERYPDRIELSNPGSLLVSRAQLLAGGVSECRNKALQLMFLMIGGGEKAGSGMDKIRSGWQSQHWRSPKLEETVHPDRVRLLMPMVSLIPAEVDSALRQRFGDAYGALDALAVQALVTAAVEGSVSNGRLQEIAGKHPIDITATLQNLVLAGMLVRQNQRRWASYSLAGDRPHLAAGSPHLDGNGAPDSRRSDESSPPSGFDGPSIDPDSPHSAPGAAEDSPRDKLAHLPAHLWLLAEPARGHRLGRDALARLIQQLCADTWLSSRELSLLLQRDPENLQTRVLTGMVNHGQLVMRYPSVANRPDQAYRAAASTAADAAGTDR